MGKRFAVSILALSLAVLLAACGTSPPTQFIALSSRPGQVEGAPSRVGPPIVVARISLPPELDRLPLVSYGPNGQIKVNGTVVWAAPLDESIRRTLTFDLANRLGDNNVVLPGQPSPSGASRWLVITIQRFAPGPNDQITLDAHWLVITRGAHQRTAAGEATITTHASSAHSADLVEAMSAAIATLSEHIADFLDTHQ